MAVELGKLSMWLETLAADKPLAFLDHHLKTGNSLVGSDITEVLSDDIEENGGQLTLGQAFARARQQTLEHVMDLMQDLLAIDNDELADIKSMEELYGEIREDPLYQRLFEVANVHTAEQFGLDVPNGVYEDMAGAIEEESEWAEIRGEDWFSTAQAMAADEDFFHWELEFPEVFFGADGSKLDGAGFDAVVGNPPYVQSHLLDEDEKSYLENRYSSTTGRWDIYLPFNEIGSRIAEGRLSYIQPTMFFRRDYGEGLRKTVAEGESHISEIVDLSDMQIFESATNYVGIFSLNFTSNYSDEFEVIIPTSVDEFRVQQDLQSYQLQNTNLTQEPWEVIPADVARIISNVPKEFVTLGDVTRFISKGIDTSADKVFYLSQDQAEKHDIEDGALRPLLKGEDIHRYQPPSTERLVLFPYEGDNALTETQLKSRYPNAWDYLQDNRDKLESRTYLVESGYSWYEFWRKREEKLYKNDKILSPEIADQNEFTIDRGSIDHYFNTKVRSIKINDDFGLSLVELLGILNSSVVEHMYKGIAPPKRGGYRSYLTGFLKDLLIPTECPQELENHVETMLTSKRELESLNQSFIDYLGNYSDGPTLADVGLTQPPEDSADSILQQTTEQKPNLRVGEATVVRESDSTVEIQLTARYKPDDEDAYETDQWGYTETEPLPALRITDLTETEVDLIEAFVPVAVDEAGGFAGFRETATKTNSLVDRLRKLTLPAVDDVRDGLASYTETVERADELEGKIERTDELIDEIVYELYGLTNEEIKIVEEAVGK